MTLIIRNRILWIIAILALVAIGLCTIFFLINNNTNFYKTYSSNYSQFTFKYPLTWHLTEADYGRTFYIGARKPVSERSLGAPSPLKPGSVAVITITSTDYPIEKDFNKFISNYYSDLSDVKPEDIKKMYSVKEIQINGQKAYIFNNKGEIKFMGEFGNIYTKNNSKLQLPEEEYIPGKVLYCIENNGRNILIELASLYPKEYLRILDKVARSVQLKEKSIIYKEQANNGISYKMPADWLDKFGWNFTPEEKINGAYASIQLTPPTKGEKPFDNRNIEIGIRPFGYSKQNIWSVFGEKCPEGEQVQVGSLTATKYCKGYLIPLNDKYELTLRQEDEFNNLYYDIFPIVLKSIQVNLESLSAAIEDRKKGIDTKTLSREGKFVIPGTGGYSVTIPDGFNLVRKGKDDPDPVGVYSSSLFTNGKEYIGIELLGKFSLESADECTGPYGFYYTQANSGISTPGNDIFDYRTITNVKSGKCDSSTNAGQYKEVINNYFKSVKIDGLKGYKSSAKTHNPYITTVSLRKNQVLDFIYKPSIDSSVNFRTTPEINNTVVPSTIVDMFESLKHN